MDTFLKRLASMDAETAKKLKAPKSTEKATLTAALKTVKKWMTEFNINLDYVVDSDNVVRQVSLFCFNDYAFLSSKHSDFPPSL
ncbi:hypothetical protein DPMN_035014 [Dreissena polymorpha]|uniref:Uncharacterized protein n=1 Tax=Dreissena polymorpha TaxID=45954 RepID=A0A9D4RKJ4_DREPO|nr:hypothetical protein DPMN_035014 [Dreissena polymorpha]